jgi:predicted ArsR family transcriptional regulator
MAETVRREGRGRPGSRYRLTAKARRLFPDRSAELANELFDFISDRHGRPELLAFLRWRAERQSAHFAAALADATTLPERAEALAGALTVEGFDSSVQTVTAPDGATLLQLKQGHCAIADVAREHPELCAFEASLFKVLLGARLSRRQTIAGGADACVCTITPSATESSPDLQHRRSDGDKS